MGNEFVEERYDTLYVANSRVSLQSIIHAYLEGDSAETIRENFTTLTLAQVYGALAYYLANKTQADEALRRERLLADENRRNAPPIPAELRRKLEAAREALRANTPA